MNSAEKQSIRAWLTNFKEHFLSQEIYPNRYHSLYFEILRRCQFKRSLKIGIIPCDGFSVEFSNIFCHADFHFFEGRKRDVPNFTFIDNHAVLTSMDRIFLFAETNKEKILSKLPPVVEDKVEHLGEFVESLDFQPYIHKTITNIEFLKFLICLKKDYRNSFSKILKKSDDILFVRQNFYSDVPDKVRVIAATLHKKVVVEDNSVGEPVDKDFIYSRLMDIVINFLRMRHRKTHFFFIPILRDGYGLTYVLKTKFLSTKVISNFTDYIYDLCRSDKKQLLAKSYQWSFSYTDAEYYFADKIMNTKVADAIIHRHGVASKSWSNVYRSPSIFFPPYQDQYKCINTKRFRKKLVFIGAVHSMMYDSDLFKNMYLEECFTFLVEMGYSIDLYYAKGYERHAEAYKERIKSSSFTTKPGKPLSELLPLINGYYDWGLLFTDLRNVKEKINTNYRYTIPTKIYTYLGINLPILCYIDDSSSFKELITSNGLGRIITEKELVCGDFHVDEKEYQVILNNIETYNKKYNLKNQTQKLSDFFRKEFENNN